MITETHIFRNGETQPALSQKSIQQPTPKALNKIEDAPEWAKLSCHQCTHCPLKTEEINWCPAALSIAAGIDASSSWVSTENVKIEMIDGNRRVIEKTTAANALSSIFMNQIVHSTCPAMKFDFWLWKYFSSTLSIENVLFRRLATDLIYRDLSTIRNVDSESTRIDPEDLVTILTNMTHRIRSAKNRTGDAAPNALVTLSSLSTYSANFWAEIYDHLEEGLTQHKTLTTD